MNSKNDYIREYLGVDKFHARGYTGTRVKALSAEDFNKENATQHSLQTRLAFLEIAPDAMLSYAPFPGASNTAPEFQKMCKGACVMFASLSTEGGGAAYAEAVIPDDLFVCVSAGNDGGSSANGWMSGRKIYGAGAVDIRWSAMRGGEPLPGATLLVQSAPYTSHSENVDFGAATGLYLPGYASTFTGTSCAAPVLAGIAALVNDFFIQQTGRPLSHEAMYQFLKDCTVDIEAEGKDNVSGWGVPRLPDPDTIDIWKYQTEEDRDMEDAENEPEEPPVKEEHPKEEKPMKVLIIAGHGGDDTGAVATHGGKTYKECDEARKLAAMLVTALSRAGVVADSYNLLRNAYNDYKEGSLVNRARFHTYDLVLELHFNAFQKDTGDGKVKGVEAYMSTAATNSETADAICKAVASLGFANRGVKRKNYAVIGTARVQGAEAILLEICFLDDADDMALYDKSREAVAQAIAEGVAGHPIHEAPKEKTARQIVQEKAGLEEKTMDYLAAYRWGKELIEKLAKAMQ